MAKILTFAMLKGGTGKSTIAFNVITTRAILDKTKRYLMIDLDMQSNLTNFFGIESYEKLGMDSSNMLLGEVTPEEIVIKSPLSYCENVDLIPSSFFNFKNEINLNNKNAKEFKLERILKNNKEFFDKYDYIVIDTNPSFSVYNINAFYVTDSMINIVKDNCISSLKALEMSQGVWAELREDLGKEKPESRSIIINMNDERSSSSKQFKEHIYSVKELESDLLKNKVRSSVVFVNASLDNKPVYLFDNKHNASEDILNVIKELESRNNIF